ncbi:MAG: hypothetical protein N2316_10255 [Spirochaetes bacterium]|nr:hypothetical protein [Spirochaetota bacterium]
MSKINQTIPSFLHRRIRQHVQAKRHSFFAIVQPGFERISMQELINLHVGTNPRIEHGGIVFSGKLTDCYKANIASRTITRIIMRIAEFRARRFSKLRERAGSIPWELYITPTIPVNFSVSTRSSRLFHTERIALECYRAISARFASMRINCPDRENSMATNNCVQTIFIRLVDDVCTISIDSSGTPLYKRGYKLYTTDAPIRETIAAAILLEAGCENINLFFDPMSGSGTFSLEAAMIALKIAPGLNRRFAFEHWPAYSDASRKYIEKKLHQEMLSPLKTNFRMIVSDIDAQAVDIARKNLRQAGLETIATFYCRDFFSHSTSIPNTSNALVALNPPYGKRLLTEHRATQLYQKIAKTLRAIPLTRFALIIPHSVCEKSIDLFYSKCIPFRNGGIRVKAIIR